ncbi:hypothetical protein B0H19DRAFT_1063087 [Mycena capillaripes]|nr:hypothetical protein B0H19DRAFT_1063087 [Mycena capillaripes]
MTTYQLSMPGSDMSIHFKQIHSSAKRLRKSSEHTSNDPYGRDVSPSTDGAHLEVRNIVPSVRDMFYLKNSLPPRLPFSDDHAAFEEQSRSPSSPYSPAQDVFPATAFHTPRSVPQRAEPFTITSIIQYVILYPQRDLPPQTRMASLKLVRSSSSSSILFHCYDSLSPISYA